MDWRLRRQIIIASIFFIVLALIGSGFYFAFLRPKPTCSDGIKNQGEAEIDCGGPCVSCEILTLREIEVVWTKAVGAGNNKYDLAARIKNPNPNFGAPYFSYKFELKNAKGEKVGEKEGTSFILPGSSKYLVETNFESSQTPALIELSIEPIAKESWKKIENYQTPELFVKDKKYNVLNAQPNYNAEASGVVQNNTVFDFDRVYVNIIVFDSQGEVIGISGTEVRTLLAGEGRYFSNRWSRPLAADAASIDMEAQTNLFADSNYMRQHGTPGSDTRY